MINGKKITEVNRRIAIFVEETQTNQSDILCCYIVWKIDFPFVVR